MWVCCTCVYTYTHVLVLVCVCVCVCGVWCVFVWCVCVCGVWCVFVWCVVCGVCVCGVCLCGVCVCVWCVCVVCVCVCGVRGVCVCGVCVYVCICVCVSFPAGSPVYIADAILIPLTRPSPSTLHPDLEGYVMTTGTMCWYCEVSPAARGGGGRGGTDTLLGWLPTVKLQPPFFDNCQPLVLPTTNLVTGH